MSLIKSGDFTHELFGTLRVIKNEVGDLYFIGKEVAEILGYADTSQAIRTHCKGGVKITLPSSSGNQDYICIPERDLYRLVMRSKKEEAERFEEWVVGEVLPAIRKTGSYSVLPQREEDLLLTLFPGTDENLVVLTANTIRLSKEQGKQLLEQKPKVEFYDQIADTTTSFDMQEVSALLKLKYGRNTLFKKLREAKVLMLDNLPYRHHIDSGCFVAVESKWLNPKTDQIMATTQTRITQKGLDWLLKNKDKFKL